MDLSSMMRMLSTYVLAHAHSDVRSLQKALRRLSEARDCIQRSFALPR